MRVTGSTTSHPHDDAPDTAESFERLATLPESPERGLHVVVPKKDLFVDDTWFTLGLRGTGSKDLVAEEVFVPAHRSMPTRLLFDGHSPHGERHATLINAADHVLRMLDPTLPEREYRHRIPDGWDFWQYRDTDETLRYLRVLRDRQRDSEVEAKP